MEKNSQENAVDAIETIETIETKIDINNLSSETKDDILRRTKQHRESIDEIIVPQYEDNYVVTYSKEDSSFLVWKVNIEQNGQQHPDSTRR